MANLRSTQCKIAFLGQFVFESWSKSDLWRAHRSAINASKPVENPNKYPSKEPSQNWQLLFTAQKLKWLLAKKSNMDLIYPVCILAVQHVILVLHWVLFFNQIGFDEIIFQSAIDGDSCVVYDHFLWSVSNLIFFSAGRDTVFSAHQ
jgi:hypothetical protein